MVGLYYYMSIFSCIRVFLVGVVVLTSCTSLAEKEEVRLQLEEAQLACMLEDLQTNPTRDQALVLLNKINRLSVTEKLTKMESSLFLRNRVDSIKSHYLACVREIIPQITIVLEGYDDIIMGKGSFIVAKRLSKGDRLQVSYNSTYPIEATIHNAGTKIALKKSGKNYCYQDSFIAPNTAIYLIEFTNTIITQYVSYEVCVNCQNIDNFLSNFDVVSTEVPATKQDYLSYSRDEYGLIKLYDSPRQYTLQGGWKSTWGGHKRTILPLNLPQNAVNVAYQLRVDTSKGVASRGDKFYQELNTRCSSVKIFGTTIKEKNDSHTSLLREILNDMRPPIRVEEAYCSMYVFYDESSARNFVDKGDTSKSDINYSLINTQSCNGNIPVGKHKNIYLGFENNQFSGSIYLWVEAVATTTQTNYYRQEYTY